MVWVFNKGTDPSAMDDVKTIWNQCMTEKVQLNVNSSIFFEKYAHRVCDIFSQCIELRLKTKKFKEIKGIDKILIEEQIFGNNSEDAFVFRIESKFCRY